MGLLELGGRRGEGVLGAILAGVAGLVAEPIRGVDEGKPTPAGWGRAAWCAGSLVGAQPGGRAAWWALSLF